MTVLAMRRSVDTRGKPHELNTQLFCKAFFFHCIGLLPWLLHVEIMMPCFLVSAESKATKKKKKKPTEGGTASKKREMVVREDETKNDAV